MPAKFHNPELLSDGSLRVTGPFSTDGVPIPPVPIRFLMIGESRESSSGAPWMVGGVAEWTSGGEFEYTVPASEVGRGVSVGDVVRGVGLAAVAKEPDGPGDPPWLDTMTWCVNLEIVGEGATLRRH